MANPLILGSETYSNPYLTLGEKIEVGQEVILYKGCATALLDQTETPTHKVVRSERQWRFDLDGRLWNVVFVEPIR